MYRAWREARGVDHETAMWGQAIVFAVYIYLLCAMYLGGVNGLLQPKFVLAAAGYTWLILLLCAMGMSVVCYYFGFPDVYMAYRKHLIILAWVYAVMHFALTLILAESAMGLDVFMALPAASASFLIQITTLVILTFLTVISHRLSIRYLTGPMWRAMLRLGYLALLFGVAGDALVQGESWWNWLTSRADSLFPPLGLIVFMGAAAIAGMRWAMHHHVVKHKRTSPLVPVPAVVGYKAPPPRHHSPDQPARRSRDVRSGHRRAERRSAP